MCTKKRIKEWPLNLFREVLSKRDIELDSMWSIYLESAFKTYLTEDEALILYMYYRDGVSIDIIAERLNYARGNIPSMRMKIVRKLRQREPVKIFKRALKQSIYIISY
jgi:predicted DNA-binding protein YlxM (UPF0122 family)